MALPRTPLPPPSVPPQLLPQHSMAQGTERVLQHAHSLLRSSKMSYLGLVQKRGQVSLATLGTARRLQPLGQGSQTSPPGHSNALTHISPSSITSFKHHPATGLGSRIASFSCPRETTSVEFESWRCHSGRVLNYDDFPRGPEATKSCTHRCCVGQTGGLKTKMGRGVPVLSKIAENKIMGEMNGSARLWAAGDGVEAATDNTIYRWGVEGQDGEGTDRWMPGAA